MRSNVMLMSIMRSKFYKIYSIRPGFIRGEFQKGPTQYIKFLIYWDLGK